MLQIGILSILQHATAQQDNLECTLSLSICSPHFTGRRTIAFMHTFMLLNSSYANHHNARGNRTTLEFEEEENTQWMSTATRIHSKVRESCRSTLCILATAKLNMYVETATPTAEAAVLWQTNLFCFLCFLLLLLFFAEPFVMIEESDFCKYAFHVENQSKRW